MQIQSNFKMQAHPCPMTFKKRRKKYFDKILCLDAEKSQLERKQLQ